MWLQVTCYLSFDVKVFVEETKLKKVSGNTCTSLDCSWHNLSNSLAIVCTFVSRGLFMVGVHVLQPAIYSPSISHVPRRSRREEVGILVCIC